MTSTTSNDVPRHILCGLDLAGRAAPAVHASLWLAQALAAEIELVHAFPPRPILWGKAADMPEWTAGSEAAGRALRESLRSIVASAPPELALRANADALRFHVTSGPPAQVILDRARVAHADLIVVGPHARHGMIDLGGTARAVLAHASSGVWIQPAPARVAKSILVAVDGSAASLHALARACALAQRLGARVTALHAFAPPEFGSAAGGPAPTNYVVEHVARSERDEFEAAMRAFDWRGAAHDVRFEQGEPAETVLRSQDAHDLIVMGTHGRTGLAAALLGSVTSAVLRGARIPVLALREPRQTFLL